MLLYPYGRDQAVFADVARTILSGGMPYRDVWEIKPPGVYLLYAAITALLGPSMAVVRVVDLLLQAAAVLLLYQIGRPLVGRRGAALGALIYAALYLHRGYWSTAQAESFAALPTLLVLLLCRRARRGHARVRLFLAGVLAGCVVLLKYPLVLPCVLGLVGYPSPCPLPETERGSMHGLQKRLGHGAFPLSVSGRGSGGGVERNLLRLGVTPALLVGLAVPLIAAWAWLVMGGAWGAYLEIQREFVAPYARIAHGEASWGGRALSGAIAFGLKNSLACLFAVLGVIGLLRRRPGAARVLLLWSALATAVVAVQGKYFGYHWVPLLLPLALLAGAGLASVPGRSFRVALILFLAWLIGVEGATYRDGARVVTRALPYGEYLSRFGPPGEGDYSFLASTWAAGYARATTRRGEGLFVWGFEPGVYLLSERRPPTRFHFAVPLVSPWAPAAWRLELMRDLAARPPALIMVLRNDAIPWASGRADDSTEQLARFPELAGFLARHYRFERRIEDFALFRRKIVK
jgi:hypothetical protein